MDKKPTPLPRREFTSKLIHPYLGKDTAPLVPKTFNRGEQISRRDDKVKTISIGLEDIDYAVQFYFENVIKPNVIQNKERISVPVVISSPEKFKAVQIDGFYRDKNGKVMMPLITYKRESITKNRELGNKLDANRPQNIQFFQQKYSRRNVYDNFSVLQNTKPEIARSITVIPDYITVTYSCIIFTNYMEQNNKLVEAIEFASDSYWGDVNKFMFRTYIDTFNTATILEQNDDRGVKSTFDITLNGYIIPNTINKELAQIQTKIYDRVKVVFTTETVSKI